MHVWLLFGLCAAVIWHAGTQLVRYGDRIAALTPLGKTWVGLVLLAVVTSLPELFTAISAVAFNDLPDMAVSSTIGSCMFNMMVIAMLDFVSRKKPVSHMVHQGHIISAGCGIVLMGFAAIDILFGKNLPVLVNLHKLDPLSISYPIVYLIAMKLIFSYERTRMKEVADETAQALEESPQSLKKAVLFFVLNAVLIVSAACFLPALGEQIGKLTGWGESFIGSSFLAVATSLPEAAVAITAARRGSFDMAVASLLGSNLFNIVILTIADFCYLKGPLLRSVSTINALTALTAIICMGIVVVGLTFRPEKKILFLSGDALAIILVCLFANTLLFLAH